MNILFISFAEVSLRKGAVRLVAILQALADAGHRVDLIAPKAELPDHPHLRVLAHGERQRLRRFRLKMHAFRATGRVSYDAVHAVDDAVFFAMKLGRWKKIPLIYDASRRFTGHAGAGLSVFWKLFPRYSRAMEARALDRARIILSPCPVLTADLVNMNRDASVVQVEDIPLQPLYKRDETRRVDLLRLFAKRPGIILLCDVLPGDSLRVRNLLVAARKVIESVPDAAFCFRGMGGEQAEKMAASLDIAERCAFIADDDPETFLTVLEASGAVLFVPPAKGRYIHQELYTLLCAGRPLVVVHGSAHDAILTEDICISVLEDADAMAEGLLRVIQEPLFSLALATAGQQLIADGHACSSFKHQVRMAYHQVFKKE